MTASAPNVVFLLPGPRLGRTEDVLPERIEAGAGDWIELTRTIADRRRKAARKSLPPPVKPTGAEACPAMAELSSIGLLLKWPETAILRRQGPKAWEIKPSTPEATFYRYSPLSSFPEGGEAEVIEVETGWMVVTPPGFSLLFKNVPNNLRGAPKGLSFAEGVLRADQATLPLITHAYLKPGAKEIKIRRGTPMAVVLAFRREPLEYAVVTDPARVEAAGKLASADRTAFGAGAGVYRKLYVEGTGRPSPLYPELLEDWKKP